MSAPRPPSSLPLDGRPSLAPSLLGIVWTLTALETTFLTLRLYWKLSYSGAIWYGDPILTASYVATSLSLPPPSLTIPSQITLLTTTSHQPTSPLSATASQPRVSRQNLSLFLFPIAIHSTFYYFLRMA